MTSHDHHELAARGINAMKITTLEAPLSGRRGYTIDPHDGRCHGQHNITVTQFRNGPTGEWGRSLYTMGPIGILSEMGTREILHGLEKALELGAELDKQEDVE